ncbi:MAG: hypothetical protein V7640_3549, partial [Betaproteobacteria bacterium]
ARGAQGVVVSYAPEDGFNPESHECVTRMQIAQQLATLKGYEFAGEYDESAPYAGAVYYVPSRTLVGPETAARLGIRDEHDLFGGVVPHAFVCTKTITHPLVNDARVPEGWCPHFTAAVTGAVLAGHAAFTREDAERAGQKLFEHGPVRVKPALAVGGRGQSVVKDMVALKRALAEIDARELASCGVVLEQNLEDVTTYSVGQVCVAQLIATYVGTQGLTTDHHGAEVYGGSDLIVARGNFDALLTLDIGSQARRAVMQARTYDQAASKYYRGFFASRRNYDIAEGRDCEGRTCCGVLEQSWRVGGASGAEIAALEAFDADPELQAVRARCIETYGPCEPPPRDAMVYFCGVDEKVGPITKYTVIEPYVDTR